MKAILTVGFFLAGLAFAKPAHAHEAYVLSHDDFVRGLGGPVDPSALRALKDPGNLQLTVILTVAVAVLLILAILFWRSSLGRRLDHRLKKMDHFGPLMIRAAISIAFIASALTGSFLGPEISQSSLPGGPWIGLALFTIGVMVALGFMVELAALSALAIFGLAFLSYQWYLVTYLNYLGEIVVLILFGSRVFSIDKAVHGLQKKFARLQPYEGTIVRVCYGLALFYAAVNVKLLHPQLTLAVVNNYHLTQFNWLFPPDPLLVALGAALAEMAIGLLIIIGFQTRLVVLISLFYITLSLLYFQEAVWPHVLLYGISLSLLLNDGGRLTLDGLINRRHRSP